MAEIATIIDTLHLEDLRNEIHPSIFDINDGYDVLIVRLPIISKPMRFESHGFVITQTACYVYNKTTQAFEVLHDGLLGLHHYLDDHVDLLVKAFKSYPEQIESMEEHLYDNTTGDGFMTQWLGLKRDLVRIERVLGRSEMTVDEMTSHYEAQPGFPINAYVDLHEHMDRITRSATLQLSKLDYIYNFYNVRTNEKMNRMIYLLTIISAIFLPLNLVVGFFGMNTSGLPFSDGSAGTISAIVLMGSLMLVTTLVILLWRKRVEA